MREVDKVKILMSLLKNAAKKAVSDHYKELDSALEELLESFGNEEIIWDGIQANIKKELGDYKTWGKTLSKERLTAVNDFFDYLRQAVSLADDHPELEKEIYSRQTLSLVRSVLPLKWDREFIKSVSGLNPSYRISFQKLMNFAEEKKTEIHFSRKTRIEVKEDQGKNKGEPSKSRSNVTNRAHFQGNKHI